MTFGLMIDLLIIVLLLVTIGYAALLSRRLSALRAAKAEMQALLESFSQSTAEAERAMQAINRDGRGTAEALERLTAEARGVSDDLTFLLDRGNRLADRLSDGGGDPGKGPSESVGVPGLDEASAGAEPGQEARAALLKSLGGMR